MQSGRRFVNSLYNHNMKQHLHSLPWPKGFIWEIVEFEDCLKMKVYRDNLNSFDSDQKLLIAKLMGESLRNIFKSGIPIYTWVAKGDGRNEHT